VVLLTASQCQWIELTGDLHRRAGHSAYGGPGLALVASGAATTPKSQPTGPVCVNGNRFPGALAGAWPE
jgi:hypothetical protein